MAALSVFDEFTLAIGCSLLVDVYMAVHGSHVVSPLIESSLSSLLGVIAMSSLFSPPTSNITGLRICEYIITIFIGFGLIY
ncbi:hypothetical protein NC651_027994 [Populus alba x Populus x berolinensis]|nr:hypothetical protein NC651_027994 [Populus alba x Populus x berolinensis]